MRKIVLMTVLTAVIASFAAFAGTTSQDPWAYTLGLSYLGTTGNTDNQSIGTDFTFAKAADPWGIEGGLSYMRGSQDGNKTMEKFNAMIKGTRKLNDRWDLFLSGRWDRDRYSGFDDRYTFAAGATFKAINTSKDQFLIDAGLSWNHDKFVSGDRDSYWGGLLQLRYTHCWTTTAKFQQRLLYIPDFSNGGNWRGESETAIITSLTKSLAFKGSFLVRYNHEPPIGFRKTDTQTALSLVYSF